MSPSSDVERFLPLKPAHFHILLSLVKTPLHGYGMRRAVEERTDGRIVLAAGTLYETLQRLERSKLIEETEAPAEGAEQASMRWRFYRTTVLGRRVLAAEVVRLESDLAAGRAALAAVDAGS